MIASYGLTPLALPVLFRARPKGVPYQVTKAGLNVVSVMPWRIAPGWRCHVLGTHPVTAGMVTSALP